jgi:antitoxin VapB
MGREFDAKVFKSGNSIALRLPKSLGLKPGDVMRVHENEGSLTAEPITGRGEHINLKGIYGSVPGITRPPCDENPRDWYCSSSHA